MYNFCKESERKNSPNINTQYNILDCFISARSHQETIRISEETFIKIIAILATKKYTVLKMYYASAFYILC